LLQLDESRARELIERDPAIGIWALLRAQALLRQQSAQTPRESTPSAQIPPYLKSPGKQKPKKRGRKAGHKGARRGAPPRIDRREEHALKTCPDCGSRVSRPRRTRRRIIEDIAPAGSETTEHTIHSHYCPQCKKRVEPKVTSAMPGSTIGNRTVLLAAWLHYGLNQTLAQILAVLGSLFHFQVTAGGLTQQWARLGLIFEVWYAQIAEAVRNGGVLQADETGWRVNGQTHWLWCFASPTATYYQIEPSRGSDVINEFLKGAFAGTLVSDFFGAYNLVQAEAFQKCLAHLLRELNEIDKKNSSDEWVGLRRTLARLLKDALRLGARTDRDAPDYLSKRACVERRMDGLLDAPLDTRRDADTRRILKRLIKYRGHLFTFLYNPAVPPDNNRAEREIRPAVLARKNSLHNTSGNGARLQAIFLSIYRTLKLRGHDPLTTMGHALAAYIQTGQLPPLPGAATSEVQPDDAKM
jgi:hypothetical protein